MDQDAKVVIKGDTTGVQDAFRKMGDAIAKQSQTMSDFTGKSLSGMREGFASVQGVLGTVMGRFTLLAGVVAGGAAAFKQGIDASVSFTKEANSLARVLGITATEATAWNVALGDIYQDSAALIGAVGKLNRVLAEDEEKITSLGIKTRDASGNFRAQGAIFQDVTRYLAGFKEGIDRNVEGARIFGKSWGEVAPLMKLTGEAIEGARVKADELGLTVTQESAERVSRYRAAINDVGDVMQALGNAIGQSVMPVFTRLSEWFASIGPGSVLVFRGALNGLSTLMQGLVNGLNIVWQTLVAGVRTVYALVAAPIKAMANLVTGDFKAAEAALTDWPGNVADSWRSAFDSIAESSARTANDIANLWGEGTATASDTSGATAAAAGGKGQSKDKTSRVNEWSNVLDQQRQVYAQAMLAQGNFSEWGKQEESNYWAGIMARQDLSREERLAVESKYYAAERGLRKEAYAAQMAEYGVRLEQTRQDYAARVRIADEALQVVVKAYGVDSKEYKEALKRKLELEREQQDKLREIRRISLENERAEREQVIADREADAQLEASLGVRTQQSLIEIQREGARQRLAIELEALAAEQAAWAQGTVEYAQIEAKKAAAKRKAAATDGDLQRRKTEVDAGPLGNAFSVGENAITSSLNAILAKGRSAGLELSKIWRQVGLDMVQELAFKPLAQWVAMWAKKLAMNLGFLSAKNAQEATSAGVTVATEQTTGLASIGVSAARAAAGAYAAIAGIPVVGPVLAPVTAAAALAAVLALGKSMFSAEGGFDIPGGVNPIVQTHAREMILPAKYADVIRGLSEGGGGQGGGGGNFTIQALDARSFERMLAGRQGDQLVRALARRMRNGG